MTRSRALLFFGLFVALAAGCQLSTDGQGSITDLGDASSSSSSPSACELNCAAGSRCELRGQDPVCVPFRGATPDAGSVTKPPVTTPDAGSVTKPPVTTPPVVCNLACVQGSHCVVEAQGPACVPDAIIDAGAPPPVACNLLCVVGRHCKVTAQGQSCVLDQPVLDAGSETPCGTATCAVDEMCCSPSCGLCEPKGGLCPAIACPVVDAEVPKQTCTSASCPTGTYCDDITGTVECKTLPSCNTVKCTPTTTCELVQVQCIRAPCPPQPQCVPKKDTQVCNLACKVGTHCVLESNGPKCESDSSGMSCGNNTCGAGQFCCNASCGTCASAGGACTQIACLPTQ